MRAKDWLHKEKKSNLMEYIKQEITKYSEQSSKFVATLQRAKKASAKWCVRDKLTQPLYPAFPKIPNHRAQGDSG